MWHCCSFVWGIICVAWENSWGGLHIDKRNALPMHSHCLEQNYTLLFYSHLYLKAFAICVNHTFHVSLEQNMHGSEMHRVGMLLQLPVRLGSHCMTSSSGCFEASWRHQPGIPAELCVWLTFSKHLLCMAVSMLLSLFTFCISRILFCSTRAANSIAGSVLVPKGTILILSFYFHWCSSHSCLMTYLLQRHHSLTAVSFLMHLFWDSHLSLCRSEWNTRCCLEIVFFKLSVFFV